MDRGQLGMNFEVKLRRIYISLACGAEASVWVVANDNELNESALRRIVLTLTIGVSPPWQLQHIVLTELAKPGHLKSNGFFVWRLSCCYLGQRPRGPRSLRAYRIGKAEEARRPTAP